MSGDYETHNDRQPNITYTPKQATYHIYLNDKCLFKNLNESEFDLIWDKIYYSYWREELTYVECIDDACIQGKIEEHSY